MPPNTVYTNNVAINTTHTPYTLHMNKASIKMPMSAKLQNLQTTFHNNK